MAAPTGRGGIDTDGLARMHPMRAGRRPPQIGRQGLSKHRWRVGGTLCRLLNQDGVGVAWAWATAHVAENTL